MPARKRRAVDLVTGSTAPQAVSISHPPVSQSSFQSQFSPPFAIAIRNLLSSVHATATVPNVAQLMTDQEVGYLEHLANELSGILSQGPQSIYKYNSGSSIGPQQAVPATHASPKAEEAPPPQSTSAAVPVINLADNSAGGSDPTPSSSKTTKQERTKEEPGAKHAGPSTVDTNRPSKARKNAKNANPQSSQVKKESQKASIALVEEKRLKRWRPHPPQAVQDRMERSQYQRMFVIGREPVEGASPPEEIFRIAGTTGNVYTVHIKHVPECDCPDGQRSGTCKHILYIMSKVLKAREDLVYQAGLLSSELELIFRNAPKRKSDNSKSNQKPLDEDDCPICYYPLEKDQKIVFCEAMCGSNLHEQCFNQWAASCSGTVTCVMCRTPWKSNEDVQVTLDKAKPSNDRGYLNVADQLGLSGRRDSSSYHSWGRRRRYGWD